jgi:diacylglycerol O-acyltransferase
VPLKAPKVPWSAAITPHRSVAFARVSLDDVKAVKNAFGIKVNDVVLSLVTIAVRRYLEDRAVLPKSPLVALVPMSVRTEDEKGHFNNRVSPMWVNLRTDIGDPRKLIRAIARASKGAKDDQKAVGARLLMDWTEHAAPSTFALAARVYSRLNLADRHRPIYNLTVSNVPGPTFPLYLDGAELVAAYPMGPVSEGAGLNITVLSYRDHVDVGFLAGRELVPELGDMAQYLEEAMGELLEAAGLPRPEVATPPGPPGVEGNGAAPAPAPAPPAAKATKAASKATKKSRPRAGRAADTTRPSEAAPGRNPT